MSDAATPAGITLPRAAVFFLALASFASALSLRVTDAQLPRLAEELGVSLGNAAYIVTTFSIAYGASQLFFGPLGDRHGKYLVVGWACVACAVTASICAIAPGYQMLLAGRLLAGATAGAIIPLSMAWLGDVVPYEERQPVLARFLAGQILGLSTGMLVGGIASDYLSWRVPFIGIALLFAVVATVLLKVNRQLPAAARLARKGEGPMLRRILVDCVPGRRFRVWRLRLHCFPFAPRSWHVAVRFGHGDHAVRLGRPAVRCRREGDCSATGRTRPCAVGRADAGRGAAGHQPRAVDVVRASRMLRGRGRLLHAA
jgi:MFS family permease